jgi:hypothetical protein
VDDVPIRGHNSDRRVFEQFLAHYDAPAYVRRARQVQEAFDRLVGRCRHQREEWLPLVRVRLGMLQALAGDWDRLRPWLADDDQLEVLRQLQTSLDPRLRVRVEPTSSSRALRRALQELQESIDRFNRRWHEFLRGVDLTRVNQLREGYNRYFLLEKECAVRSFRLAREGYCRLEPLTVDALTALLPPLPVPQGKG